METTYAVRVKLEEGYARPRWYTVFDSGTGPEAAAYALTYLTHDEGISSVLALEIVSQEAQRGA